MSLVVGDPALALSMCEVALGRGLFAQALVPPAVPALGSRLRLTAMASHRPEELQAAARLLGQAARQVGFDPSTTIAYAEPDDERYDVEPAEPYEVEHSGLFDYERIARAA